MHLYPAVLQDRFRQNMAALNKRVRDYNLNCPVFAQMLFFDPVEEALSEKGKEFLGGPVLRPPLVCSVCVQDIDRFTRSKCEVFAICFLYIFGIPRSGPRLSNQRPNSHIPKCFADRFDGPSVKPKPSTQRSKLRRRPFVRIAVEQH